MTQNDYTNLKLDLLDELKRMNPFHTRGRHQYSIRCPMCGDSRKSKRNTHFYVNIDPYSDTPVLYHCFICTQGGLLNPTMLKHMDIRDIDLNSGLTSLNRHIRTNYVKYQPRREKLQYIVPDAIGDKSDETKRKYISDRLGIEFTYKELLKLKTIFSLGDFVVQNEIEELTVFQEKAEAIDDNYVGFLTMNNEFINFRQVKKCKYKRYEKYSVERDMVDTVRFYTIPTTVNLLTPETITINIAEGVFDIMGVYYHIDNGGKPNSIYSAITGSDYMSVMDYYISEGFVGNVVVNIYSDSEVPRGVYNRVLRSYGDWVEEINLFYNTLDEDFGVPLNRIRVSKSKLR